ncbi:MAG: amidase family protein [Thiohalomonadales bacterium]|nr:amidase family protein [Thiohalomonadales bacterium]
MANQTSTKAVGWVPRPLRLYVSLLWGVLLALSLSFSAQAAKFELMEATISEINAAYENRSLTAERLVQMYLDRIAAYDKKGPEIRAMITVNPNALKEARALDKERQKKGPRSLLHGIPVIIKDNYDTADMPTTAGSVLLKNSRPPDDAFIVKKLRDAGAVIIGKANMSEFALSFDRLSHSSLGGLTRNPYNLKRNVAGSSSGSAAAVAANFAVFATGSDTAGSIRAPANVAGTVGIKPTLGLTSRDGIVPVSLSYDVTGPIARTVADAAIALQYMAGVDPNDPRTLESRSWHVEDYSKFLDANALEGARIGIARDYFGGNPEVDETIDRAIAKMRSLGATFVELNVPKDVRDAWQEKMELVIDREIGPQLAAYLQTIPGTGPKSLKDLIKGYKALPTNDSVPLVSPARIEYYEKVVDSPGVADIAYLYTLTNKLPVSRIDVIEAMESQNLDAIVFPTMPCPASPLFTVKEDPTYVCNVPDPWVAGYLGCVTGFPEITVPAGMTQHGLPIGISFYGKPYTEPRLIGLAYAFEQATKARKPPPATPPLKK